MQDRYVGDVGDYAKYALIRGLAPPSSGTRLGFNWYMFPDEAHNGDGRHVSYLVREPFAALDRPLHSALKAIVDGRERSVLAVRRSGVLPSDALHYAEPLPRPVRGQGMAAALAARRRWADDASAALADADLVFLDPDNGIEVPSVTHGSPKSGKYVLWDEIAGFWSRGQSLLVYHHLNRTKSVAGQADDLGSRLDQHQKATTAAREMAEA